MPRYRYQFILHAESWQRRTCKQRQCAIDLSVWSALITLFHYLQHCWWMDVCLHNTVDWLILRWASVCVCVCVYTWAQCSDHWRQSHDSWLRAEETVKRVKDLWNRPVLGRVANLTCMYCRKTADSIEMPFELVSRVGLMNHILDGNPHPSWEGANLGKWCSNLI